jgi:hypothetical protein
MPRPVLPSPRPPGNLAGAAARRELAARLPHAPAVRQAHSALAQRQAMLDVEQRRATPDVTVSA